MYLAVPVDIIKTLDLTVEGRTLPDVMEQEAEKARREAEAKLAAIMEEEESENIGAREG